MRKECDRGYFCEGYKLKVCPNDKTCKFYKPEGCKDWTRFYFNGKEFISPIEDRYNREVWVEL